jgi:hypothetical protein
MDSKDLHLEEVDYEFFKSLISPEKIWFLYDLLCGDYFEEEPEEIDDDDLEVTTINKSSLPSDPKERIRYLVEKSLEDGVMVSTIAIQDKFILNSDSKGLLTEQIRNLFSLGYVLQRQRLTDLQTEIFKHKKHFAVMQIVGKANYIFSN